MNVRERLRLALDEPEGPRRTAAVSAWFQGLFGPEDERPVLVGGAAVEVYTEGAYVTGDLDFVGRVPPAVAEALRECGFRRKGRHWLLEREQIFLELPAEELAPAEPPVELRFRNRRLRIISPEALLADRLAAWKFWGSETDAFNALRLLQSRRIRMRPRVAARLARELEVEDERRRLVRLARTLAGRAPTPETFRQWMRRGRK